MYKKLVLLTLFHLGLTTLVIGQSQNLASTRFRSYTIADIPTEAREVFLAVDKDLAEERTSLLSDNVADLLFTTEAKRRGITVDQLKTLEIRSRVSDPAEMTAKAYYEAHRNDKSKPFNEEKAQIAKFLRRQIEEDRARAFLAELEKKFGLVKPHDVNAVDLKPDDVLVSFADQTITARQFAARNAASLWAIRADATEEAINALENAMFADLLLIEAKELSLKSGDDVISKLTDGSQRAKDDLEDKLFAKYDAKIILTRPELQNDFSIDGAPFRGDPNAPVTIVMFSDLQCPHCAAQEPILEDVAAEFGKSVKLVVKNFPLTAVHDKAFRAAEAAMAADEQGKYWEYTKVIFKNQDTLDDERLVKFAGDLGLDTRLFSEALTRSKFAWKVNKDLEEGNRIQILWTPTVFVNGYRISSPTRRVLREVIRQILNGKSQNFVAGQINS